MEDRNTPTLRHSITPLWSFQRAEELDEIAQVVFGQDLAQTFGHGRECSAPGPDICLFHRDYSIVG